MTDVIQVEDRYYILASSSLADDRTRVLKHGDAFAVFDRYGDVQPIGMREQGLYRHGTRFLSSLTLSFSGHRPMLLSSTVREDNLMLSVDLTNHDILQEGKLVVPRGALHVFRSKALWRGSCYERLRITNYSFETIDVTLMLRLDADYADVFEVRGMRRERRGEILAPRADEHGLTLSYLGLDAVERRTLVRTDPPPERVAGRSLHVRVRIPSHATETVYVTTTCDEDGSETPVVPYDQALEHLAAEAAEARARDCRIYTSNEQFNDWIGRSVADVHMMSTRTEHGLYPYAGVPWFSTVFGRDGIIAALEFLWVDPSLARGVLAYLAATQATHEDPERDAQPGKILHEFRRGEMAAMGEVPFGRYYGSIDATPLFVVLAGAYHAHTGDDELVRSIWPAVLAAMTWIDERGDLDGDGFVEYFRQSPSGLANQGWKDSLDSVSHADGTLAEGPIALCEVQAYVYAARMAAAALAAVCGSADQAEAWRDAARRLKARFEEAFWVEELGTYALALDGEKRRCEVRSSNAGHCLFGGIADPARARRTAETLLDPAMFSGWGIRTLASTERRYDPMSYHNGSVWPHDNALIAGGFSRYGLKAACCRLLAATFDASLFLDLHRLPELFCGFERRPGQGPTLYPVACLPQTWASAAAFHMLRACLGLEVEGDRSRVVFKDPTLPGFLRQVQIDGLRVAKSEVDLLLQRHRHDVGVGVGERRGEVGIVVLK